MLKKAKLYSLLAIMVASTIVGLLVSPNTATAQQANSGTVIYVDPGLEKDVKTKAWRAAMLSCLRSDLDTNYRTISPDKLKNGDWFKENDGEDKNVGYFIEPTDGRYECHEDGFVSGFVNYFGWNNEFFAACSLGYIPTNNQDATYQECIDSDGQEVPNYTYNGSDRNDGDQITLSTEAIDKQATYTTDSGQLGNSQMYVVYLRNFQIACATNPNSPLTSVTPGSTETYLPIAVDDGRGDTSIVYYEVDPNDVDDAKYVRRTSVDGQGSNEEKTCRQLSEAIDEESDAYVKSYSDYVEDLELTDEQIALGTGGTSAGGSDGTSTCRVDGIGWIICPVVNLMAEMVDDSYYLLDNNLLRTPAVSLDTGAPLYKAWKLMRDFANVAFVLVFMFIIFSQITSFGISNYGIKQLLPKLIIAAILVNLSYVICALAVDVSNLVGSELKGFFDDLAAGIDASTSSGPFKREATEDGSGKAGIIGWGVIAGSILVSASLGGGILAILALLVPFLFAALGAVIATVLTLIIRQALIIILIFVAPLAFVALLLPNTEGYFKSWRKLFQSLLLLYPVIALVFGGSALASTIIMSAAQSSGGDPSLGEGLGGMTQTLLQLSGAAVSVIPLFLVPTVIKVAGGALNRFAGIVNNPNKGPIDWARNRSMKGIERKQKNLATKAFDTGRRTGVRGRAKDFVTGRSKYHREADMKREDADRDRELALQEANYGASQVKKNIDPSTANDRQMRELAGAISTQEELKTKELRAATLIIEDENFSGEDRQQLALKGYIQKPLVDEAGNVKMNEKGEVVMGAKQFQSETMQKAAAIMQFTTGSAAEKMAIAEATAITEEGVGSLAKYSAEIAQAAAKTGFPGAAPQAAGKGIDDIAQNNFNFKQRTMEGLAEGRFTSESVAGMNDKIFKRTVETVDAEIAEIAKAKTKGVSTQEERKALEAREAAALKAVSVLQQAAAGIKGKDNLQGKIEGNELMEGLVNDLAKRSVPTHIGPANIPVTSPSAPSGSTQPTSSTPATPQQPNSAPSPTTINGGRQRDWSGYGQPIDTGIPTQTESPTFTPGQSSTPATPTPSTINGGRQRDWSGYDQSSNATADAMEKVAKELKNTASQMDENNSYGTVERVKEAVSSTTAQTMQQFYDNQPTSTPASPTPPSTPPTINGGRQRDWSGYNTPTDNTPTQTESPTYRPDQN